MKNSFGEQTGGMVGISLPPKKTEGDAKKSQWHSV